MRGGVGGSGQADDLAIVGGQQLLDFDAAEFIKAVDRLLEQIVRARRAGGDADDDVALGQPVVADRLPAACAGRSGKFPAAKSASRSS